MGVCDEDLFTKVVEKATILDQNNQKFFFQAVTASNHDPYRIPKGKIDSTQLKTKEAAIKYADYSIGKFISLAKKQRWFSNTIFIFVSDHGSQSMGKDSITLDKFHVPLIFYSPGLVAPEKNNSLACQIDVGPTLFGLLNFNYISQGYGNNLLEKGPKRAFIKFFDRLGYLTEDSLTILSPYYQVEQYDPVTYKKIKINQKAVNEAISFYQHASDWKTYMKQEPLQE